MKILLRGHLFINAADKFAIEHLMRGVVGISFQVASYTPLLLPQSVTSPYWALIRHHASFPSSTRVGHLLGSEALYKWFGEEHLAPRPSQSSNTPHYFF